MILASANMRSRSPYHSSHRPEYPHAARPVGAVAWPSASGLGQPLNSRAGRTVKRERPLSRPPAGGSERAWKCPNLWEANL